MPSVPTLQASPEPPGHVPARARPGLAVPLAVLVLGSQLAASDAPPPHRVIIERKVEVLGQRLQQLARDGYRLLDATDGGAGFTRSNEFRLHLSRIPDGTPVLEYRIVSGEYSGKLVKLLDQAGAEGFEVHPRGVLRKAVPNPLGNPASREAETAVLILERDGLGPPDDYELLAPGTARQFGKELGQRAAQGFSLAGLRGFGGGWLLAVLARPVIEQPPEPPSRGSESPYLAVDERERKKLFDEVGAAAARGFRIVATVHQAFPSGGDAVLMARATDPARPYSYYFLGQPDESELEDRLNEGAAEGYRFREGLDPLVELIMERAPLERVDVRYRAVLGASAAELERAVNEALGEGWTWSGLCGDAVVLERPAPKTANGP